MSPLVRRAMVRFHTRYAQVRLKKGDPVGVVVAEYLSALAALYGALPEEAAERAK